MGGGVTRGEAAARLAGLFAPFGVPVVADPLDAVVPPAIVIGPGSPYREPASACWQHTLTATLIAGRLDDVDVYDRLDDLADTLCHMSLGPGLVNRGASGSPETSHIGDVDYLTVAFTLTAYNLGLGLTI